MYYEAIVRCTESLKTVQKWLDKAQAQAAAKKFEVSVLLASRLAPDMNDFVYQVQSACDYVKGGAAWLSGQKPPSHRDDERTLDEVRERIRKTVAFVESIPESQYAAASTQRVAFSFFPGKEIVGCDYLLQMVIPNVYFHLTMAYAILRHNGVEIGKMDFLGPLDFVAV